MRHCLRLSRQGHPTIAHRFNGGFKHACVIQPRQGRQKTARSVDTPSNELLALRGILPSLTGLIRSRSLNPTVETESYCRVSLTGQRPGNPEINFAWSRVFRSCPSPDGGHGRQFAHVLAKRGYESMSLFFPCEVLRRLRC